MITNEAELLHITKVMEDNGYQECSYISDESRWYVVFEFSFNECRIHHKLFMCADEAAAYRAVRSLLRRTNVYCVVVHSPVTRTVVSYYGTKNLHRDWMHYYH